MKWRDKVPNFKLSIAKSRQKRGTKSQNLSRLIFIEINHNARSEYSIGTHSPAGFIIILEDPSCSSRCDFILIGLWVQILGFYHLWGILGAEYKENITSTAQKGRIRHISHETGVIPHFHPVV